MKKKNRIHQDTTYDNLVKRLGHCGAGRRNSRAIAANINIYIEGAGTAIKSPC